MRTVFGLLFLAAVPSAFGAQTWLKAETPDATVYSDASRGDLEDFAVRYAEFRVGFNALIAPDGRRAPPSTILLFRKAATLKAYVTSPQRKVDDNLTSWTTTVDYGSLFALGLSGDVDEALTTTFEFDATWMMPRIGYIVPLWMSQGAGEVLASTHARKNKIVIGDSEERLTRPLDNNGWLPWEKFFDLDRSSPEYTGKNGQMTGVYQGQAWALMHLVLLDSGNPRERFQRLAAMVHGTRNDLAPVALFLGTTPAKLGELMHSHLFKSQTREFPLDVAQLKAAVHITPAPEAEIRVELGDLLRSAGNNAEAQMQYDRARYLAPNLAMVKEAEGRSALAQGDHSAAAQDYRDAIAAGSRDPEAYLISAEDRLNDASSGGLERAGSAGDVATLAVDEIRHALTLSPGNGAAYSLLGRAYFVAGQISEANVAELTPALSDPDYGRRIRYYRALIYERLGMNDASVSDLRFILTDANTPQGLHQSVQKVLESKSLVADEKQVNALVARKDYAGARAVIAAAQQRGDETTGQSYEQLSTWIDDNVVKDRMNELVAAKNWTELRKVAALYQKDHPHGQLANAARQMRQLANQALRPKQPAAQQGSHDLVSMNDGEPVQTAGLQLHVFAGNRHWADFQNYLDHLETKVLNQWDQNLRKSPLPSFSGKISVAFTIAASGDVVRIDRITPATGVPDALKTAATAAIEQSAPFEHWPDEMTEVLGGEQHLLISFAL